MGLISFSHKPFYGENLAHTQLATRVEQLTQARDFLLHGELMDLKIKAKFAERLGRDLLREIAD